MDEKCVLLDTSFFIRLLNGNDPLHENALGFYRHFLEKGFRLKCSTISVAEYCVKGKLDEMPLKTLEILPFNLDHSLAAAEFAQLAFAEKNSLDLGNRLIIPNDTKLFGQAHVQSEIRAFVTSDVGCIKVFEFLKQTMTLDFEIMNIREPFSSVLGVLPLTE
ncbi:MAG: hypothetical protein WBO10_09530 [Pyrinomonadaceae bacterium]